VVDGWVSIPSRGTNVHIDPDAYQFPPLTPELKWSDCGVHSHRLSMLRPRLY
jgi:hypothetical protein